MREQAPAIVVTGGSRGLGRGIAVALAGAGYSVGINYVHNEAAAQETVELCRAAQEALGGGPAVSGSHPSGAGRSVGSDPAPDQAPEQLFIPIQADIGSKADRDRLVDTAFSRFETVQALVNNAGVAPKVRNDITEATEESFSSVLNTNLQGPYFLTQAFARRWLAAGARHSGESGGPHSGGAEGAGGTGGHAAHPDASGTSYSDAAHPARPAEAPQPAAERQVVFVGSISADTVSLNRGEYCVAKAGIAMAAKLWAARLVNENIHVFEVRPGIMETDMTAGVKEKYDRLFASGAVAQPRWGTPQDVGDIVVSLVGGGFRFAVGSVIYADGGFHIQRL